VLQQFSSLEHLKREIKIHRKLEHPHIIKLHHYFEDGDNVYITLEYAQQGSLFHYLRGKRKLPENEVFVYFFQTCVGIDYLHKKNIVHRDLKVTLPDTLRLINP
jgi:serine/threonine protein kinase